MGPRTAWSPAGCDPKRQCLGHAPEVSAGGWWQHDVHTGVSPASAPSPPRASAAGTPAVHLAISPAPGAMAAAVTPE